jgi:glucose-6-phosphate isomerase
VWSIDSFDQWGVELGKVLAGRIEAAFGADPEVPPDLDSSTRELLRRYEAARKP